MKSVSASRAALRTALAGATVAVPLVVLAVGAIVRWPPDFWYVNARFANATLNWKLPLLVAEVAAGPIILAMMFVLFFLIGRRAARPIEAARLRHIQFTADASHELRTPLTIIEGEASLALRRLRHRDEYRAALERISAESQRMRALLDDLLWLARSEGHPERPALATFELSDVATRAVARFEVVASTKEQRLMVVSAPKGAQLQAPAGWPDRLMNILLENACRYTPVGGEIRVAVESRRGSVGLVVEDSGPGIQPEHAGRIFDRFYRAAATVGGSGLGLAIADQIVAETGGIWRVGRSQLGGARMEVRWRPHGTQPGPRRAFMELSRTDP